MVASAAAEPNPRAMSGIDLEAFCRREHPKLVGAVGLYLNDRAAAEDIAQEALLRACRAWARVQLLDSPGGWTHRVAMNLAVSHARSRSTRRSVDARLTTFVSCSEEAVDSASAVAMRAAVAKLGERERQALVLRYYADLSVADVAAAMRCPEGTVKTLTSRAVGALRKMGWEVEE